MALNLNIIIVTIFLFFCWLNINVYAVDLPSYIKKCKRTDPNLNDCLLKATEKIRPYLAKGIPEINLEPLEPFSFPEVQLKQGTSALNFKAKLKNNTVYGLTGYKFSRFDFDVPNLEWLIEATIGSMVIKGEYHVRGKVLFIEIEGHGMYTANITGATFNGFQKNKIINKNGEDYLSPIVTNSTIHVSKPKVKIDNLFRNNEELNRIFNSAINNNADILFEELRPVVEKVISKLFEDLIVRSVNIVPYDKLYPV